MTWALQAEWTKLRTLPSTVWLLLGTVVGTIVLGAAATAVVHVSQCPSPTECFEDTAKLSLTGVWLGQVTVVVLGVLAMTGEYDTRTIHPTLAAVPDRRTVLAAKAAVVTGSVLVAGVVGVVGSIVVGRFLLPGNGFTAANGYPPMSLSDGPTLRAAVGTVIYLGLVALLSLGVGTVVRDTAGAITAVLSLLYLVPLVAGLVTDPQWHDWLDRLGPMTAGLAIQATERVDQLPIGPWAGLGVLASYAGAALAVGALMLTTRDA
ncbi:MAG: ABC transporter permease subunit [Nocardioidaceae bacterium]